MERCHGSAHLPRIKVSVRSAKNQLLFRPLLKINAVSVHTAKDHVVTSSLSVEDQRSICAL